MIRTEKLINEELDDARLEFDRERLAAKNIFERARNAKRELTDAEQQGFNTATDNAKSWRARIGELETELQNAAQDKRQILAMSQSRHPSSTVFQQSNYSGDERVLPTNGRLPGDTKNRYGEIHPISRLKSFRDPQT